MTQAAALKGQKVGFKDLREYLQLLESAGLLTRVKAEVDLKYEIGAICAISLDRRGPALLFENIKGYAGMPLVSNIISTTEQLAIAFNTEADENKIFQKVVQGMTNRIAPVNVGTGPCKEEIHRRDEVDVYKFPTPVWHELDGGQYIATTAGCITKDPVTGAQNMGTYRGMIKDKKTITLTGGVRGRDAPSGPSGPGHILENEEKGLPTPIALAMGMDPLLTFASGTGVPPDSHGDAEFGAAGFWRGSPTELVKCETSDLLVPANAEIIIEGEVLPNSRTSEGPHGEAIGFYGHHPDAFVIKINCITHRRDPITYGLICRRLEDYPRSLLRSGTFQARLIEKSGLTNIREVYGTTEIGWHSIMIVSAEIRGPEEPRRIMEAAWDTDDWRWVIVVDEDCDVRDLNEVLWRVTSAADPKKDIVVGRTFQKTSFGGPLPECGLGIDATMRFKEDRKFPPVNTVSRELKAKVAARWQELGLPR